MGTNYYTQRHYPFDLEQLHIGKSSYGWVFSLNTYPELNINTLEDWKIFWSNKDVDIFDEYGGKISVEQLLDTITNRRCDAPAKEPGTVFSTYSEYGPDGLLRARLHGNDPGFVGRGEGTWDYYNCEFC